MGDSRSPSAVKSYLDYLLKCELVPFLQALDRDWPILSAPLLAAIYENKMWNVTALMEEIRPHGGALDLQNRWLAAKAEIEGRGLQEKLGLFTKLRQWHKRLMELPQQNPLTKPSAKLVIDSWFEAYDACYKWQAETSSPPPAIAVPATTQANASHGRGDADAAMQNNEPMIRAVGIFSDGVSSPKLRQVADIIKGRLSINDKLFKIDAIIPIPANRSAPQLGKQLQVSPQAVKKTQWWKTHRQGKQRHIQQERLAKYAARARVSVGDELDKDND